MTDIWRISSGESRLIILKIKLKVKIKNERKVFLDNLDFEIEIRVSLVRCVIKSYCFAHKCVQTYHSDKYRNDFSEPDCARGLDDPDVDEHVG